MILVGAIGRSGIDPTLDELTKLSALVSQHVDNRAAQGRPVRFVRLYDQITEADLGPDGLHPADGGHRKFADAWFASLQPLLAGRAGGAAAGGTGGAV